MNVPRVAAASLPHPTGTSVAATTPRRDPVLALSLGVTALIHLLPLPGVFGATALQRLYGLAISDPGLLILLQHRAVLFGLLGMLLIGAIRIAPWRVPALVAGLVSAASFIAIAGLHDGYSAALQRVVLGDGVAVAFLALGAWRQFSPRRHRRHDA